MTYEEFRRQLGKAGLTNRQFADLVKINPNSITNFKKEGEVPDHWAIVALLMGLLADQGIDYKEPISRISLAGRKVRGAAAKGRFGGSKQIGLHLPPTNS